MGGEQKAPSGTPGKSLPFTDKQLIDAVQRFPTPFHMYSEDGIRSTCRRLKQAFSWSPSFTNYFAVKATPNPHLLKLLKDEGLGADCSSLAELMLAESVGLRGDMIMFTSNNTPINEYQKAKQLGAIINLDDISHIDYLHDSIGLPEFLSFRYNPGPRRAGNVIIGDPKEAKFGLTRDQLFQAYTKAKQRGVKRFGLHAMVVSNCTEPSEIVATARMLFELVVEINKACGVEISMVNLGGGLGVNYKPDQAEMDVESTAAGVAAEYDKVLKANGFGAVRVVMENGRFITGPNGFLIARVVHHKNTYKNYIGLDANMAHLMRPGMYTAYHHVTFVPTPPEALPKDTPKKRNLFANKDDTPADAVGKSMAVYDIVGGLCENNDKFAIDRPLPSVPSIGDIAVIHDAGAHGHSMGFQYNGKLRSAEYLYKVDPATKDRLVFRRIRRGEKYGDYFATIDGIWPGVKMDLPMAAKTLLAIAGAGLCVGAGMLLQCRMAAKQA
ncbi:unnamed protein product [Vitrella brassicaformis CCMP3155]|uniref:Diaminopimelate decarboxylase n=2 Tax=Vitrella brassicaformis TaxID=1169539 RepID=A0A0G4F767_VITBC|nr:unnamed protein product [Vitrella brassicaformis CCMP3155]|mmetsp:Transcript_36250/g.90497  ORF Transcript_36250/g.90497 Transcript_36250/m.90497 type:complete len:497 (+) Transcript_36250:201-1691(+)|eukprot:CEM08550.1 unnamed protein product [Vitrella brassicaformis CCMP3155]